MENTQLHDLARRGAEARIAELQQEVEALEKFLNGNETKRAIGRPRKITLESTPKAISNDAPRRYVSATTRKILSKAMKARWAKWHAEREH